MDVDIKNRLMNFEQLRVLVIDDNLLIHDVLKKSLYELGIRMVSCAQSAYYGVRLCNEKKFDIVICSFNVNSDRDGFHLLEELKVKGFVTRTTVLIFLSTETDKSLVNAIIELDPDDFWAKPLVPKLVQDRLVHTLKVKQQLFNIYYTLDQREYSKAIYFADRCLADQSLIKYKAHILRMKGEALLKLLEYSEAEIFYKGVLKEFRYGWVYIGYVQSLLKQGRIDEIKALITTLIEKPETCFATHDLLAQYYIEHENYQAAYEEIKKATALSPRNIDRNRKSWDLARLNHDHQGQYLATQNIAKQAKNSIHDSPELMLNVIRSAIDLVCTVSDENAEKLLTQAEKYIKRLEVDYGREHDLTQQLVVIQARLWNAKKMTDKAQRLIDSQISLRPSVSIEDNLDKVKVFHELGMREEAALLLQAIKNQILGDSLTSQVINRYIEQETQERSDIHYTPKHLHEMAEEHVKKGRYLPALEAIIQAQHLAPTSIKFASSLMNIMITMKEKNELDDAYLEYAVKAITTFEAANLGEATQAVVNKLIERWKALTEKDQVKSEDEQ
ncbi:response regulator [Thalassotalea piscium]|uniref:CheY-like chemotaxis protein n=1 Tax=Thalassotalea piscium TaxID=1230533 RepID=A0A7X0TTT5_9GAMM|nr:response regulator [Thalassotalea piscium]MBB6543420.1 CheY-like chemotaxis protein [Thalassotalea piscium]